MDLLGPAAGIRLGVRVEARSTVTYKLLLNGLPSGAVISIWEAEAPSVARPVGAVLHHASESSDSPR